MNHELDMDRIIDRDPRHNRRIRSGLPHREEPDSLRKFPKEKETVLQSRQQKTKKSLFTICKNVTRYIEVKIALSMPCMAEHLIPLADQTSVVRPRGGAGVSVALFRLEPWIRM